MEACIHLDKSKNPRDNNKKHGALPKLYRPDLVEPIWQDYWEKREVYEAAYRFDRDDLERTVFVIDTHLPSPLENSTWAMPTGTSSTTP